MRKAFQQLGKRIFGQKGEVPVLMKPKSEGGPES